MGRINQVGGNIRGISDLPRNEPRQVFLPDPNVQQQIADDQRRLDEQMRRTNDLLTDLNNRLHRISDPEQFLLVRMVIRVFQFIKRYFYLSIHSLRIPLVSSRFEVIPAPSKAEKTTVKIVLAAFCVFSSYWVMGRVLR